MLRLNHWHRNKTLLLFCCGKGTKLHPMFYSRNTQRTPCQNHTEKKNRCLPAAPEVIKRFNPNMVDPCASAAFRTNSLLLFVKLLQLSILLILSLHSVSPPKFWPVRQAEFLPPRSPLKPRAFVDGCITWTSLRAMLFKAILASWFWSVMTERVCDGAVFICMPSYMRGLFPPGDSAVPGCSNCRKNEAWIYAIPLICRPTKGPLTSSSMKHETYVCKQKKALVLISLFKLYSDPFCFYQEVMNFPSAVERLRDVVRQRQARTHSHTMQQRTTVCFLMCVHVCVSTLEVVPQLMHPWVSVGVIQTT